MSQKQLAISPTRASSFIHGWPGLPPSSARDEACVVGKVAVRLGKGLRASWLRIELRKVESVPGTEPWGELIGSGPLTLWCAGDPEREHEWQVLTNQDFPFRLPVPTALPPSARIDKAAGVGYELVASLCVKLMRGMFRKKEASVGSVIQTVHPLVLVKHELLPIWRPFSHHEQHTATADFDQCRIRMILHHDRHAFGPGDDVEAQLVLHSETQQPVKLKHLVFSLVETITFKTPQRTERKRASLDLPGLKSNSATQRVTTIASRSFAPGNKLQLSETRTYDMRLFIPRIHTLVTITTAKRLEVTYTLRVSLQANKRSLIIDNVPVKLNSYSFLEAERLAPQIGYVEGLTPLPTATQSTSALPSLRRAESLDTSVAGARNEGSITMSAIMRNPLRRSSSMASVSTGLSSALNRSNVAGRGVAGVWQSHAVGAGNVAPYGGRFSLPPAAALSTTPVPVRAALVSEAMTMGLNGAERLALTSQIDRRNVKGISVPYMNTCTPIVLVHPPAEEGPMRAEHSTPSPQAAGMSVNIPTTAQDTIQPPSGEQGAVQQAGQALTETQAPQTILAPPHSLLPQKGEASAIPRSVSPIVVDGVAPVPPRSSIPPGRWWSKGVLPPAPSSGWGFPLHRSSKVPRVLQVSQLREQEEEGVRAASVQTVSPQEPPERRQDGYESRSDETTPAPVDDGPIPAAQTAEVRRSAFDAGYTIIPSSSFGSTERWEHRPLNISASSWEGIVPTPSSGSGDRVVRVASETESTCLDPPGKQPELETQLEQLWCQTHAQTGEQRQPRDSVRPLPSLPQRPLPGPSLARSTSIRVSYDAQASGAYGARGALVVDCTAPRGQYDPLIATSPWGSTRSSSSPSRAGAPPLPPKVLQT